MAIKTFEHILILAKDIKITKIFYVEFLDLELVIGRIFYFMVTGYMSKVIKKLVFI